MIVLFGQKMEIIFNLKIIFWSVGSDPDLDPKLLENPVPEENFWIDNTS
jgi:hypothetical protein